MTKPLLAILLLLPLSVSAEQCHKQTPLAEKALPLQEDTEAQKNLILLADGWPGGAAIIMTCAVSVQ